MDVIKFLIAAGADPNLQDIFGNSPSGRAWMPSLGLDSPSELDIGRRNLFECLLETFGFTELHETYLGISSKSFQELLESCPRDTIDQGDNYHRSTLLWAAQRNDADTVEQLLIRGADPNQRDREGETPLCWALLGKSGLGVLNILLSGGADVNNVDYDGETPLHFAAGHGNVEIAKLLVKSGADIAAKNGSSRNAVQIGLEHNNTQTLEFLLAQGGDINEKDKYNEKPIHDAIRYSHRPGLKILLGDEKLNYKFIDNDTQETILHFAAYSGDIAFLNILCSARLKGINVEKRDLWGSTALENAQWRRDYNVDWSQFFIFTPDEGPERWYAAFVGLMDSIVDPTSDESSPARSRIESLEFDDESMAPDEESISSDGQSTKSGGQRIEDEEVESEDWHDAQE